MDVIKNKEVNYFLKQNSYLSNCKYSNTFSKTNNLICGTGINLKSKSNAIYASIGEFFEREIFMPNNLVRTIYKNKIIKGYSFINNKTIEVDIHKIIGGENFVDSCSLASHVNSNNGIFNALKEFIERQSFIFNYLSKSSARLIRLQNEDKFRPFIKKFPELDFYEISIIEDFYVILCKGISNGRFYIGLGASNIIDEAILHSMQEVFLAQHLHYIHNLNKMNGSIRSSVNYSNIFMSIPADKLNDAYEYLNRNKFICDYKELKDKPFCIEKTFLSLNEKYCMDPLVFFLKPLRDIDNLKFIKIVDLNWFPNLFPKSYSKEVYDFIENVTNKKLDRRCTFIPFH